MTTHFGLFDYASPPRTATTWIRSAAVAAGLECSDQNKVHFPHEKNHNGNNTIKIMTVRHPCDWLRSWYTSIYPGVIGVYVVDSLRWKINHSPFDAVVRQYLQMPPGWIGRMYAAYNADVLIRVEDLPWAFIQLLDSLGVERKLRERCLDIQPMNSFKPQLKPRWNPSLKAKVVASEYEFIQAYEY